jgi:hypothetical protein
LAAENQIGAFQASEPARGDCLDRMEMLVVRDRTCPAGQRQETGLEALVSELIQAGSAGDALLVPIMPRMLIKMTEITRRWSDEHRISDRMPEGRRGN